MMKRIVLPTVSLLLLQASPSQAATILDFTTTSGLYMGLITGGDPASEADEASYINYLADINPALPNPVETALGQDFRRTENVLCYSTCVDAVVLGSLRDESSPPTTFDLGTGYLYLLAKYDGPNFGSAVWYVGGLTGEVTIPGTAPKLKGEGTVGLSHWTLFNPGDDECCEEQPDPVPEPATLALLGFGLLGAGAAGRRRARKRQA